MLKYFFIVAVCVSLISCKSKSSDEESLNDFVESVENMEGAELVYGNEESEPKGIDYVSTSSVSGLDSEVMTVWWNETTDGIRGIWYSTSKDEAPVRQRLISQNYNDDTEVITGEYQQPGKSTIYVYEIKGNRFLSKNNDVTQEFIYK